MDEASLMLKGRGRSFYFLNSQHDHLVHSEKKQRLGYTVFFFSNGFNIVSCGLMDFTAKSLS